MNAADGSMTTGGTITYGDLDQIHCDVSNVFYVPITSNSGFWQFAMSG